MGTSPAAMRGRDSARAWCALALAAAAVCAVIMMLGNEDGVALSNNQVVARESVKGGAPVVATVFAQPAHHAAAHPAPSPKAAGHPQAKKASVAQRKKAALKELKAKKAAIAAKVKAAAAKKAPKPAAKPPAKAKVKMHPKPVVPSLADEMKAASPNVSVPTPKSAPKAKTQGMSATALKNKVMHAAKGEQGKHK